jgi:hypothetical protein
VRRPGISTVSPVVWYPLGDGDDKEPFVYVVLGKPRP